MIETGRLERVISTFSFYPFYLCRALTVFAVVMGVAGPLAADPVPVRHVQGTLHGFLILKTMDGSTLASGDLVQVVRGDRVTARLTFHFRDGSLDDETTVFSQRKVFQLISDRHVQHGPSFPKPLDMFIDVAAGQVTSRDKDGKSTHEHVDFAPDVCNGLPLILMLNLDPATPFTRLSMVAPTAKTRLIHIAISPEGDDSFSLGGARRKATNYRIKIELGGVAGAVAPIVGKQPSDIHVWILGGEVPAFVKEEGQFYEGGPIWRTELALPVFPRAH